MKEEMFQRAGEVGKVFGERSAAAETTTAFAKALMHVRMAELGRCLTQTHRASLAKALAYGMVMAWEMASAFGLTKEVQAEALELLDTAEAAAVRKIEQTKGRPG